jgi:hypothetical protein
VTPRTSAVQLDLFGEVERRLDARAAWLARFERADWIAPHDTAAGPRSGDPPLKKGECSPVPGWRCPDPECGEVEPNAYHLMIGHGWNPHLPGDGPFDGRCHKVRHRRARAEQEACHG